METVKRSADLPLTIRPVVGNTIGNALGDAVAGRGGGQRAGGSGQTDGNIIVGGSRFKNPFTQTFDYDPLPSVDLSGDFLQSSARASAYAFEQDRLAQVAAQSAGASTAGMTANSYGSVNGGVASSRILDFVRGYEFNADVPGFMSQYHLDASSGAQYGNQLISEAGGNAAYLEMYVQPSVRQWANDPLNGAPFAAMRDTLQGYIDGANSLADQNTMEFIRPALQPLDLALSGSAIARGNASASDYLNVGLAAVPLAGRVVRPLSSAGTIVPRVTANRIAGNAFRDEIAGLLRAEGRDVSTEVYKSTPFGKRFIDIEVSKDSQVLGGIETKFGGSRYTPAQRAKDWWLKINDDYIVNVVRNK